MMRTAGWLGVRYDHPVGNPAAVTPSKYKESSVSRGTTGIAGDDAALVERARRGDMAAYADLVRLYQDRVYNVCWRMCGHVEDARDLTQDVFLRALEAIERFEHKAGFFTWVFRIAVNLAISHRRRQARSVVLSLHQTEDDRLGASQAADLARRTGTHHDGNPVSRAESTEMQRAVLEALDDLDDEFRSVLVLRDVESFDYRQIGEILELPVGTVKSRIHRARMALRERLAPMISGS